MAIKLGNESISKVYFGNNAVNKIYLGNNLVYQSNPYPQFPLFSCSFNANQYYSGEDDVYWWEAEGTITSGEEEIKNWMANISTTSYEVGDQFEITNGTIINGTFKKHRDYGGDTIEKEYVYDDITTEINQIVVEGYEYTYVELTVFLERGQIELQMMYDNGYFEFGIYIDNDFIPEQ